MPPPNLVNRSLGNVPLQKIIKIRSKLAEIYRRMSAYALSGNGRNVENDPGSMKESGSTDRHQIGPPDTSHLLLGFTITMAKTIVLSVLFFPTFFFTNEV